MSYDISLCDPETKEVICVETKHNIVGGTYCQGGDNRLWLNITYNYCQHFRKVIHPEQGIRYIYGMTGKESIPVLETAIKDLKEDVSNNYWDATEGNARVALCGLLEFAKMHPEGVWHGD